MGRSGRGARTFAPWRHFLSDHPKQLAWRVRLLLLIDCAIVALVIASLTAPWYRQDWRVANGETLSWTLSLAAAKFKVDCSSDSPEFLDLCKTLYGRLAGDLRAVTRSICSAGDRLQDTDLQGLLEETCTDVKFIEKLSVAAGAADGICLCFMVIAILVFLLHVGSGYNNRRAWRGSFGCRVFAWLALTTSCILYSLCIRITEDLFHFQPPAGVAFDPAHAEPVGHELLYGFILAIAAAGIQGLHLLFWWKASPFDPDPYFLDFTTARRGLTD